MEESVKRQEPEEEMIAQAAGEPVEAGTEREAGLLDPMAAIRACFGLEPVDLRTYSPLTLAYLGDAVYELAIRSLLVGRGNAQASRLHHKASALVNAGAQSAAYERIRGALTEEENHIFRRGRNANSATMAKHATMTDYRRATGFETLLGWLYLSGQTERILELVRLSLAGENLCDTKK